MATADDDDIAARFAAIVSSIASTMNWNSDLVDDTRREDAKPDAAAVQATEQELRDARREHRRLERARELAEYNTEKAALEAAYNSEDDHFTPPEPPPLPTLRPVTIGAVLLTVCGIALIAVPTLLVIDTQVTMVLGLLILAGGVSLLLSRLRHHDDDPDNGAVL